MAYLKSALLIRYPGRVNTRYLNIALFIIYVKVSVIRAAVIKADIIIIRSAGFKAIKAAIDKVGFGDLFVINNKYIDRE